MRKDIVCRVARSGLDGSFGFAFVQRDPDTFSLIAEIMYSEQSFLQDRINLRQKPIGFFIGTLRFSLWSVRECMRALIYALGLVKETQQTSHPDAELLLAPANNRSRSGPHAGFDAVSVKEASYA